MIDWWLLHRNWRREIVIYYDSIIEEVYGENVIMKAIMKAVEAIGKLCDILLLKAYWYEDDSMIQSIVLKEEMTTNCRDEVVC